jgi:hypothetical protein
LIIVAIGIYVILTQNAVALDAIRAFFASRCLVDYHVDWLNADGTYGWRPVRRVFKITYVSMALRALQLVLIVGILGWRNVTLVTLMAAIWLSFLCLYIVYPYTVLRTHFQQLKEKRIIDLVQQFHAEIRGSCEFSLASHFCVREIERVRMAITNPMQLARWQSSSFSIVVLLPIALTIVQIVGQ